LDIAGIVTGFAEAAEKIGVAGVLPFEVHLPQLGATASCIDDERFVESKVQLLEKILVTKYYSCRFIVTTNSDVFAAEGAIAGR
jgi:hypothetical protein